MFNCITFLQKGQKGQSHILGQNVVPHTTSPCSIRLTLAISQSLFFPPSSELFRRYREFGFSKSDTVVFSVVVHCLIDKQACVMEVTSASTYIHFVAPNVPQTTVNIPPTFFCCFQFKEKFVSILNT